MGCGDWMFGDKVFLKEGSFIHGLGGSPDSYNSFKIFDYVVENGFIGGDFNGRPTVKILNSVEYADRHSTSYV